MTKKGVGVKKSNIEGIVIITNMGSEILEITTEEAKELAKDLLENAKN